MSGTVVYYTAQQEKPEFEARVIKTLLETIGDMPLISVSQKPLALGKNICVGNVGRSCQNAWRQLQIGAMEARSEFIWVAESDFLYPREYFQFSPPRRGIHWLGRPTYLLFAQKGRKHEFSLTARGSEGAMVSSREFLIRDIDRVFAGHGQWRESNPPKRVTPHLTIVRRNFSLPTAAISIKTDQNMHPTSRHVSSTNTESLPFWGNAAALVDKYVKGTGWPT